MDAKVLVVTTMGGDNIRIRCSEDTKRDWYSLLARVDPNLSNEELVDKLAAYFEEDETRIESLRRAGEPPEYRGP